MDVGDLSMGGLLAMLFNPSEQVREIREALSSFGSSRANAQVSHTATCLKFCTCTSMMRMLPLCMQDAVQAGGAVQSIQRV